MTRLDAIGLQVWGAALRAVADEMQAALVRAAFSVTIKERRDCSTALFDARGQMVAQSRSIPVHLGSMPEAVSAVMDAGAGPGEAWIVNDPFTGGTHLPDLTIVSPVDADGRVVAYAVTRAHHADVGGMSAGSMPAGARELLQEGLVIPPVRIAGPEGIDPGVMAIIVANSRTPDERRGDIAAQMAAHALAQERITDLILRRGGAEVLAGARSADHADDLAPSHGQRKILVPHRGPKGVAQDFNDDRELGIGFAHPQPNSVKNLKTAMAGASPALTERRFVVDNGQVRGQREWVDPTRSKLPSVEC
jgi:N-methylhydantoinase B/oxoprolinase/acetone carboxylase alpha subunit